MCIHTAIARNTPNKQYKLLIKKGKPTENESPANRHELTKVKLTKQDFIELYNKYFDDIRRYIYYRSGDAGLAADVAQDAFVKLYQMKDIHRANIKSLLYKMANQHFIDQLRKKNSMVDYQNHLKLKYKTEPSIENASDTELKEHVEFVLSTLPENDRVAYLMSRLEGKTYREIAECLNVSIKTIEKRISRVLQILKKELVQL